MKTRKKIMTGLLILLTCLLFNHVHASGQSLTGIWQLQNPVVPSDNFKMVFGKSRFMATAVNLITHETDTIFGTWIKESGDCIVLSFKGREVSYKFKRVSYYKMTLSNKSYDLSFAISESSDDHYLENYNQLKQYVPCHTCLGDGRCVLCSGSKRYFADGFSGDCSACNVTGKCWSCNGSGQE